MADAKKCDNCGKVSTSLHGWHRIIVSKIDTMSTSINSFGNGILGDYCSEDCIADKIAKRKAADQEREERYTLMNAIDSGEAVVTLNVH